ncbi:hypothetical protein Tco_1405834 [Tanacetum coccineum]
MISSISVGGSIIFEGFLSSILLVVVIIVMVVFVVVVLVVVVIAIVGVVIVVMFRIVVVVGVSSIFKLSFVIVDSFSCYWSSACLGFFEFSLSIFAIDAACAFRAKEMPSLISCRMAAKVMAGVSDVDVLLGGILSTKDNIGYDKDGDNDANGGIDDEKER